jgi:hypothetical protein
LFAKQTEGCCPLYTELKDVAQLKVREVNERRKKSDEFTEKKRKHKHDGQ